MKKLINTLALGLCVVALTACSSARGESGAADLSTADTAAAECAADKAAGECGPDDVGCCAEKAEEVAKDACCEEGDAPSTSDN